MENFKGGIEPLDPKCYMLEKFVGMSKSPHKAFGDQGPITSSFREGCQNMEFLLILTPSHTLYVDRAPDPQMLYM